MSFAERFIKHTSLYAIGGIAGQITGFIMLPIYTRYLSPADYGVIGLMLLTLSLTAGLSGVRLGQGIFKYYFDSDSLEHRRRVVSTAFLITLVPSAIITSLLFGFKEPLSFMLFGDDSYTKVFGVFALSYLASAGDAYGLIYLRLREMPVQFVWLSLFRLALQLSLNITFIVYLELGVLGVAYSSLISSWVLSLILTGYTLTNVGLAFDRVMGKKLLLFSWPLWLSGLANLYVHSSGIYYIRIFDALDGAGLYSLAERFASLMLVLLVNPFLQFWQGERFNVYHRGDGERMFPIVFQFMMIALTLMALGISLFSVPVVNILVTEPFFPALSAISWLCFGKALNCASNYVRFSFLITEKTRLISRIGYLNVVVCTLLFLALIPYASFKGAAIGFFFVQLFEFLVTYYLGKRLYDMQLDPTKLVLSIAITFGLYLLFENYYQSKELVSDIAIRFLAWTTIAAVPISISLRDQVMREYVFQAINSARAKFGI